MQFSHRLSCVCSVKGQATHSHLKSVSHRSAPAPGHRSQGPFPILSRRALQSTHNELSCTFE